MKKVTLFFFLIFGVKIKSLTRIFGWQTIIFSQNFPFCFLGSNRADELEVDEEGEPIEGDTLNDRGHDDDDEEDGITSFSDSIYRSKIWGII